MKSGEALSTDGMGQKLWLSRSEPLKVAQSQRKLVWLLSQSHFISLAVGAEPSRDNTSYNEYGSVSIPSTMMCDARTINVHHGSLVSE